MSEKRQKTHSILLRTGGKGEGIPVSLELFAAHLWPDQAGDDGLWRVRIDDVWHCKTAAESDKFTFLTLTAVGELVASLLAGDAPRVEPVPYLPYKADVRVHLTEELSPQRGSVHAPPHQEKDGRWWVWVWIFGRGPVKFPCNDVILIRVR